MDQEHGCSNRLMILEEHIQVYNLPEKFRYSKSKSEVWKQAMN
jgi:hypothetical protein